MGKLRNIVRWACAYFTLLYQLLITCSGARANSNKIKCLNAVAAKARYDATNDANQPHGYKGKEKVSLDQDTQSVSHTRSGNDGNRDLDAVSGHSKSVGSTPPILTTHGEEEGIAANFETW